MIAVLVRLPKSPKKVRSRLGAGLYHHLQASTLTAATMTEMLAGSGACNRDCNGNERSCNGFVAQLQRSRIGRLQRSATGCSDAVTETVTEP